MKIENGVLYGVKNSDIKNGEFIVPEGVTSIGNSAFYNCTSLKSKPNNYKAFELKDGELSCRDFSYTIGLKTPKEKAVLCKSGYHYCENAFDLMNYYSGEYGTDFVVGTVTPEGVSDEREDDSKRVCESLTVDRVLTREEFIEILNGGGKK